MAACTVKTSAAPFGGGGTFASTEQSTRDAICQLKGYSKATANYSYIQLKSPGNDTYITYSAAGFTSVRISTNTILVTTECEGKIEDSCTEKFISKANLVCK